MPPTKRLHLETAACSVPPLTEEDAPGWGALIDPLASLWTVDLPTDRSLAALPPPAANAGARRHAELGGALIRSLQGMLDVHAALEAASPCGLPGGCLPLGRVKAAELLPSHALGTAVGPLQLPLYERAMASQQAAAYAYMRAIAETGDAAAAEGLDAKAAGAGVVEEDSLVALGDWSVAAGGPGGGGGAEGGGAGVPELRSAFTRLYMEILTEGAADDLDGLRRDEALDEASLSLLVDALEAGADTFDDAAKGLAMESYDGPRSWWKRSTEATAGEAGAGAEAGDSAVMGKAVALEAEVRAMQTKAKGQKKEPKRDTPKTPVAKSPVAQRATDDAFAKAAAAAAAPPTPSNKKSKPSTPAKRATPGSGKKATPGKKAAAPSPSR